MTNVHTVLLDRAGYVVQTWLNTRKASLDERAWTGTLMEVDGDICPGWRWDGQRFVLPPPRPHPAAVIEEATRRVDTYFPARFREQVTALGTENAVNMQRYIAEVQKTLEQMLAAEAPPADFKDNHHWPTPPSMANMLVPHRVIEHQPVAQQPITVHVAPVIHAPEARALVPVQEYDSHKLVSAGQRAQAETVSNVTTLPPKRPPAVQSEALSDGESEGRDFGIPATDPLYGLKVALVRSIAAVVEAHKAALPADIVNQWQNELAEIAALGTAATSLEGFQKQQKRVEDFIAGKAA